MRRAAPPNAKLLIAECLIPDDGDEPIWTLLIDMIMMVELTGKERTASEFNQMLAHTGFRLDRIIDAGFNTVILESTAV